MNTNQNIIGVTPTACSLLPVIYDGRIIMVDALPMTEKEFRKSAIKMLEVHIKLGRVVLPFITANETSPSVDAIEKAKS